MVAVTVAGMRLAVWLPSRGNLWHWRSRWLLAYACGLLPTATYHWADKVPGWAKQAETGENTLLSQRLRFGDLRVRCILMCRGVGQQLSAIAESERERRDELPILGRHPKEIHRAWPPKMPKDSRVIGCQDRYSDALCDIAKCPDRTQLRSMGRTASANGRVGVKIGHPAIEPRPTSGTHDGRRSSGIQNGQLCDCRSSDR